VLDEQLTIPETLQNHARLTGVDPEQLPRARVRQAFASRRVDEDKSVCALELATELELSDPCSLDRRDGAPHGQDDLDAAKVVEELRRLEHLEAHRVLHDVDAPPRVLGQVVPAQDLDHVEVAWGRLLPDVGLGHRLGQAARRNHSHHARPQLDADGCPLRLVAPVSQCVCDALAEHDLRNARQLVAPNTEDDELTTELCVEQRDSALELHVERPADLLSSYVLRAFVVLEAQDLYVRLAENCRRVRQQVERSSAVR